MFAQLIYVNYDEILALQSNALIAGLLPFASAFAAGYMMGGPDRTNRRALAIMTFARSGSISMLIAGQVVEHDQKVMATVMTTLSIVLGVLSLFWFRRWSA